MASNILSLISSSHLTIVAIVNERVIEVCEEGSFLKMQEWVVVVEVCDVGSRWRVSELKRKNDCKNMTSVKQGQNLLAAITNEVKFTSITTLGWLFLQSPDQDLQLFTQKVLL